MSLVRVADVQVKCQCGEVLYFLTDTELGEGFYRVQHGERPEAVSPLIDGPSGERSMAWREEVHAHLGLSKRKEI